jgi:hypothetical protein
MEKMMRPEIINHEAAVAFVNDIYDNRIRNVVTLMLEELIFPFVSKDDRAFGRPSQSIDLLFVSEALFRVFTDRKEALDKALSGQDISDSES